MATHYSLVAVQRQFWGLIAAGVSSVEAGRAVGVSDTCGVTWFRKFGGVNPRMQVARGVKRPRLSLLERERIMIGTSRGESIRSIARGLGRAPSTVMREIDKNGRTRMAKRPALASISTAGRSGSPPPVVVRLEAMEFDIHRCLR